MAPGKTESQHSVSSSKKNRRISGFSLVEVMVAMGILLCFTIAICAVEILSFRNTHTLYHDVIAYQILGDEMKDIRYNLDKIPPDNQSGKRVVNGITYKWTMKLNKVSDKHVKKYLREVTGDCTWTDEMGTHRMTRHSLVAFTEIRDDSDDD